MKKLSALIIGILLVVTIFIIFSNESLTYEELVTEMIDDEDVRYITVEMESQDERTVASIEEDDVVNDLLNEPADMVLEEESSSTPPVLENQITFHTTHNSYTLHFDRDRIVSGSTAYTVDGQSEHALYNQISNTDLNWDTE
ncbi:hypothetical protein [Alkalibacillus haloalkaliphilus]|uniref:hypothetical protein n=1 Tax=Alkalibacillus haloalkaliphilus TaxID=94136 RepID=UPI00031E7667|nr:hypothetical protein [Alkalibacillus haloalkaliphilus]